MPDQKKNAVAAWLARWFARGRTEPVGEHETDYQALGHATGGLEAEYQRLVEHHLRRWGVGEHCAHVEIQQMERRKGRREVFVATIVLSAWDRNAVLRVLIGLPMLDKKVRQSVAALWLADVSEFQGVLLKIMPALHEAPATTELRHLLVSLTGTREPASRRPGSAVPLVH
jgi:hypothetical protein